MKVFGVIRTETTLILNYSELTKTVNSTDRRLASRSIGVLTRAFEHSSSYNMHVFKDLLH